MQRDFVIRSISSATDVQELVQKKNLPPIAAKILAGRGLDPEQMDRYLNGKVDDLYNPDQIIDMELGTDIIATAIDEQIFMCVYGDYDTDGVTGTAILYELLDDLGANFRYRLPDRHKEGYGMHPRVVEDLYREGVRVILTVDNGIRAHHAIEVAKGLGMTVVVVDHHEPSDTLPNADAIININRADDPYPFKGISGAAMAFKFAQVLYEKMGWPRDEARKFLDLVAIAAIADVMPLLDESRIMVKQGLEDMSSPMYGRIGMLALKEAMGVKNPVRSSDIGFQISPAINAAGRLYSADLALELLIEQDIDVAREKAARLAQINAERKTLTEAALERATLRIEATMQDDPVLILLDKQVPEGIVGLVAGRVTEKYDRMSIVFTEATATDEFGNRFPIFKASCRAPKGYHILHALESVADILSLNGHPAFGGHAGAAGCSMPADTALLSELRQRLRSYFEATYGSELTHAPVVVDAILSPAEITDSLYADLQYLQPFGYENEAPLFIFPDFEAVDRTMGRHSLTAHYQLMGRPNKIHVKMFGEHADVLAFRMAEEYEQMGFPKVFSVCGEIGENEFQGNRSLTVEARYLLSPDWKVDECGKQTDEINRILMMAAQA